MKASPPGGNSVAAREPEHATQLAPRPWPFNGYVVNNWDRPVTVWSDDKGLFQIPGKFTSSRFGTDVDHIQDASGQWWKIGAGNVTVDEKGRVSGAKCKTSTYGKDCGQ